MYLIIRLQRAESVLAEHGLLEEMSSNKFTAWNQKVLDLHRANQKTRLGQNYMIALSEVDPELYNDITGTPRDCFYEDSKAYALMEYLEGWWGHLVSTEKLAPCKHCGSPAGITHTEWAGYRIECESECSYTWGHKELQDAINEWERDHHVD